MKENHLAKWLNNELTEAELEEFRNSPEYASYVRILRAADIASGPDFDVEKALQDIHARKAGKVPGVIRLNPWNKLLRLAAVLAFIFALSVVYLSTLDVPGTQSGQKWYFRMIQKSCSMPVRRSHIPKGTGTRNARSPWKGKPFFR